MVHRALVVLMVMLCAPLLPAQTTAPATAAASQPALRAEAPWTPAPKVQRNGQPDAGFMRLHNQYVQKARGGNIDLYMLGDSITDFWEHRHKANWERHFGGWKAGDFGISGDRTQHVLWRLENGEMDGVKPKAIVLLIGTNNLASNNVYASNSVEDTFKGYQAIVEKLRTMQPQAHLLLMAVFPREDRRPEQPMRDQIEQLNGKIATLADGKMIRYLNINAKMVNQQGNLLPGIMLRDRLHPDEKGYDLWAESMEPILTEWLGAPATTAPAP